MFETEDDGRCTAKPAELDHYSREVERIHFEAWAGTNGADITRTAQMVASWCHDYLSSLTEASWQGWLASAKVRQ